MNYSHQTGLEIAIIGLAGRFPEAKNIDEFWQNLQTGKESISFFSDSELEAEGIETKIIKNPQYIKAGGILEDTDLFDAEFFGFTPREAEIMDPQHRLFLECAWEALENAGYVFGHNERAVGVYGGSSINTYLLNNLYPNRYLLESVGNYKVLISNDKDFLTTWVSYKLDLHGPSVAIQTACSTSLVAVHLACQGLLNGECDIALAGGVSVGAPQKEGYFYNEGGILSPDGHCRAFDAKAKGTVSGDGVGIVVLKRLTDAIADGDMIHAVIKGSAINNDGSIKVGYTAPNLDGQAEVIRAAQQMAEIDPETISYIEAHGTGTALGDPIEIAALTKAFRASTQAKGFCAIGSLKTNIGHLDAASGVAGLIKTVLALKHQQLPASLHFEQPNPKIDFALSPFYVNNKLSKWLTATSRRAGVSSFGIGGTNAHVILEEAPQTENSSISRPWQLLALSAKTSSALETATANLAQHLKKNPEINLADVAYTLQVGRKAFNYRRTLVCRDLSEAINTLSNPAPASTKFREDGKQAIVFLFPGQGTQYVNMGLELYQIEPTFRETVDKCCQILQPHLGLDLQNVLYPHQQTEKTELLNQTAIAQPALFVIEYSLAQLWMKWGIHPKALIGHSIGEYVAASLAGVFSLEEALVLVATRGKLMQQMEPGKMLVVPLSEKKIQPLLGDELSLAAINAPSLCVVSGTKKATENLQCQLKEQGINCRYLHSSHAFHSWMMDPVVELFTQEVKKLNLQPPQIPYMSNLTGNWITEAEATDPIYWARHLRETVRFSQGISELLKPSQILLEIGLGETLSTLVKRNPNINSGQIVLSSLPNPHSQECNTKILLNTLGRLWLEGVEVDWSRFYIHEHRHRIPLPTYPFERQRYWIPANKAVENEEYYQRKFTHDTDELDKTDLSLTNPRRMLQNAYVAPRNILEQNLADIWQKVLGIKKVGIHDNFFQLGGESLIGLQITSMANQIGLSLTTDLLYQHQTIAELAEVVTEKQDVYTEQSIVTGEVKFVQPWLFKKNRLNFNHYNLSALLEVHQVLDTKVVERVVQYLLMQHDALRLRFSWEESSWKSYIASPTEETVFKRVDLSDLTRKEQSDAIEVIVNEFQTSLNLFNGSLVRVVLFDLGLGNPHRILFITHHLATDNLSLKIILEDFLTAYQQLSQNEPIKLPAKTTSFKKYVEQVVDYSNSVNAQKELAYWLAQPWKKVQPLPIDYPNGKLSNTVSSSRSIKLSLNIKETYALFKQVTQNNKTNIVHVLLTALVETFYKSIGSCSLLVDVVGHGRETIFDNVDLSRTVGWIAYSTPVIFELEEIYNNKEKLEIITQQISKIPNRGVGYNSFCYQCEDKEVREKFQSFPKAEVVLNYLGQVDGFFLESTMFRPASESNGANSNPEDVRDFIFEIVSYISGEQLHLNWNYSVNVHSPDTAERLAQVFLEALQSNINHI